MRSRSPSPSTSGSSTTGSDSSPSDSSDSSDYEKDDRRREGRGLRRAGGAGHRLRRGRRKVYKPPSGHASDPAVWIGIAVLLLLLPIFYLIYDEFIATDSTSTAFSSSNIAGAATSAATTKAESPSATVSKDSSASTSASKDASSTAVSQTTTDAASPSGTASAPSSVSTPTGDSSSCFPLGSATLPSSGAPSSTRAEWWCADTEMYGFLGFSYPLEVAECSDSSNGEEQMTADLKVMKETFGAMMVRVYAPECREVSVWENLVKGCIRNNMGLIVQVWWGFGDDQTVWEKTQSSIYELFTTSTLADVAPFVVHSASFGSEPIGDGVDGSNFITDLAAFREKMNGYGIPVGISEDWNRDSMRSGDGLGDTGKEVVANTDIVHAHIMPYYQPTSVPTADDAWAYTEKEVEWLVTAIPDQPRQITESQWASYLGYHGRGGAEDSISISAFTTYWNAFSSNCDFFKTNQMGWYVHTFSDTFEPGFGMIDEDGKTKIDGWKPERC